MPVHVAETREEALEETRGGGAAFILDYAEAITGRPRPVPGPPERNVDQMVEPGAGSSAPLTTLWRPSNGSRSDRAGLAA